MHDFHLPLDFVPEALFERPADPVSANATRILHVSFALGHKRTCGVVMNARPFSGKMRGTPLVLLDGLRSLPEARQFDLYLKFSSYAQVGLQRLFQVMMEQKVAFFTPHIDLKSMYGSGWNGAFDLWEIQGWHRADDVSSRKRKACSPLLGAEEGQTEALPAYNNRPAPPAYTDSSPLPHIPHTPHAKQHRTHSSFCQVKSPGSTVCDSVAPGVPNTPYSPYPVINSGATAGKCYASATYSALPTLYPTVDSSSLAQIYDREMGMWILTAWNFVPDIHFILIKELLAVAVAASYKDESRYRTARLACAKKLVSCEADQMQQIESSNADGDIRAKPYSADILASEPEGCISWLFLLRYEGDIGFMELLERAALSVSSHDDTFRDVMVVRAAIVLQALTMEGSRVL
jgi:hypothetical protein